MDGQQLDEILSAFFVRWEAQSRCGDEPSREAPTAGAGRSRASGHRWQNPISHLFAALSSPSARDCYEVATGIVLWHCNVGEKQHEISARKPLLTPQLIKGRIFTLDAMHTQRTLCAQIHRFAGDYLLEASDNQPTLTEDIADLFEDRTPDRRRWKQAETWDKAHGRVEHREIICSPDLGDWFAKQWEGIEQVFRLERTVRLLRTEKLRHEVVYGLSSLSMRQAPPERMLSLVRAHWAIENKLPYRRDVRLGEDACQTRDFPCAWPPGSAE